MIRVNNKMNIYNKVVKKNDPKDQVAFTGFEKFYEQVERIPDYGTFSAKSIKLTKHDKNYDIKDVVLTVKPSILLDERPKEREIELSAKSYDEQYVYSLVIGRGENSEILRLLQDKDLSARIGDFIQKAAERFSEVD